MNFLLPVLLPTLLLAALTQTSAQAQPGLRSRLVVSGLAKPTFLTHAPGEPNRLYITEQSSGLIRVVQEGALLPGPFLDLSGVISTGGERGLLGLAFHPAYTENGLLYVNYTDKTGSTVVARLSLLATGVPLADPDSLTPLLTIPQPFSNHNGGMIAFGPDGYLYIGMGDGGSGGDPQNHAQNPQSLLGKMLRIDVNGAAPYAIPPDNPFVGEAGWREEIWSLGWRNPWRWSFDRLTGDMYVGDVGQSGWEEISAQPHARGGMNFGWRIREGAHCYNPPEDCDPTGLTDPIYEYSTRDVGCSVTGGYVYRGCAMPWLRGLYFFGDWCTGDIWSMRVTPNSSSEFQQWTSILAPEQGGISNISSFGEDADGEIYILDHSDGEVYRIEPDWQQPRIDCDSNGVEDSCDLARNPDLARRPSDGYLLGRPCSAGDERPTILAAGFLQTRLSTAPGGELRFLAIADSPSGAELSHLYHEQARASDLPFILSNGSQAYEWHGWFAPQTLPTGSHLLPVRVENTYGHRSHLWPYLTVE